MAAAFGVHFGSTSACLAVYKDGKTNVVANDAGDRVTPCVVSFTERDQAVGLPARQGRIRNSQNTVSDVKQVIGRTSHDPVVVRAKKYSTAKIADKNGSPVYEVEYKGKPQAVTPEDIAEAIFKNMLVIAQNHGAGDIHDAVVTVPVEFNRTQRAAIHTAAKNAGFNVLRLINEPTAAVLAYDIGQHNIHEYCNVLVYRVGGMSMDVTVVNINNGLYTILGHMETDVVGGKNFTDVLVDHFMVEFKRQWKHDIADNFRAKTKLENASDTCKHILSNMPTASCSVDSLYDGIDYETKITRARFESLCSSLVQQCVSPIETLLESAQLKASSINKVILCGGTTNIPCIQQGLKDLLSEAELLSQLNTEEVIAIGAAKQASILVGNDESKANEKETLISCTSKPIAIKVIGDSDSEFQTIFPALTPFPARKQLTNQLASSSTCVELYEVDCCECSEITHTLLGKIVLRDLPENGCLQTVFHIRRDGSLHVSCTEQLSDSVADIVIETSS